MGEVGGSFEPYVSFLNRLDFFFASLDAFFGVRCFFIFIFVVAVVPLSSLFMGCVYRWWLRLDVCIICLDRICLDWLEFG